MSPAALSLGDELPTQDVCLDTSRVVAMSIATRDFHPVHHDVEHARSLGHPALFINIMTTTGLVEGFVRAWAGATPRIESVKVKLGVPHYAGERLRFSGRITSLERGGAGTVADIAFEGHNPRGRHAAGTIRLFWP